MEVVGIKFKNNCKTYYFSPNGLKLNVGDKVVVETPNGNTLAEVSEANKQINPETLVAPLANVVRRATNSDIKTMEKLESRREEVLKTTKELILKHELDMKLVDCEFTLDGQKIVITYVCEDRVDFRELVKDLASKLKSRIELKQIGIRDQAKVVGGIGNCGEVCCCARYLNNFDKVSIKMAKTQNLSLNPTKISGVCGRLMCCLSYENEGYADLAKQMPKINSKVKTPDGNGTVVYNNILKKMSDVKMDGDDAVIKTYALKDIKFDGKIEEIEPDYTNVNFVMESDSSSDFRLDFEAKTEQTNEKLENVNVENKKPEQSENKDKNFKPNKKKKFKKHFKKNNNKQNA